MKINIRYFRIIFLVILTGLLFFTCNRNDTRYDDEESDIIETVKAGYSEEFKDLYHYKKFVETPLWNEYQTYKDSVATYVYVPYEQAVDYAKALLMVRISDTATDYCIKIENISAEVSEIPREKRVVGLYRATKNNDILLGGYIDSSNHFVPVREITLVVAETKGSDDYCCVCLCFDDLECYCEELMEIYGECLGVVYVYGYYSNYSDEDFFNSNGGNGGSSNGNSSGSGNSTGGGGGGGGSTNGGNSTYTTTINGVSPITIMDEYNLTVTVSPNNIEIISVEYTIQKQSGGTKWTLYESSNLTCNEKSKKAGKWKVDATVTLSNGSILTTNIINVEVQFPDVNEIRNNTIVSSAMNTCWTMTKSQATYTGRREMGFWIYLDTSTGAYSASNTQYGDFVVACADVVGINLGTKIDIPVTTSPLEGCNYAVASFHTHSPLTYCGYTTYRKVGPSTQDISTANNNNIPGILYDYVGYNIPQLNYTGIKGGHDINAASMLYVYGPNSRNTPN